MKRLLLTVFVLLSSPSLSFAGIFDGFPSEIKGALKDAYATKNNYVIEAVIKYTKDRYPTYEDKIQSYMTSLKSDEVKEKAKVANADDKKEKKVSGNVDVGLQVANGNTKKQDLNGSAKINYKGDGWSNTLSLSARGSEEGNVRTNEEYNINNQTKYDITERSYSFLELEYVNDRFSGYNYRISELLGMGYKFYDTDNFKLSGESSMGGRQGELSDGSTERSMLGKLGAKAEWKITKDITLNQDINSSFSSDAVITTWDTNIKKSLTDNLYLKFNYNLQHTDDVPVGVQHTDSFTSVGVGYEF
ncbi:MAG: DUF481 domain-containing protein [Rickettsiales bacterium]|nr:DUF481 domain-containing protein [Pseudomonadota bacterium]MDA0965463.1 DUF481 domain-containing protein [Pseudomonadota bacterium]MDG4542787.1 DUF481 domain-containing protein [Rickettsiales bacterium]MDG4544765.1 DUF481 domain-containing protein [Rickettsiales bacterium]MDG4546887.1 DUF481 domain-containing protein [Rickettsiales bacterium]